MREQRSVFRLQVRQKMPKALLVIFFVLVIGSLGYRLLGFRHDDASEMQQLLAEYLSGVSFEESLEKARSFASGGSSVYLEILCAIGFFGMVWACVDFPVKKFKTVYTIRRLQTSETAVFLCDALINTALFLVLWACAIALIFVAGRIYESGAGYIEGPQGIVAAIARNPFYRGVVPLAYPWIALRNAIAAICWGVACAGASYRLRNRDIPIIEIVILGLVLIAIPLQVYDFEDQKEFALSLLSTWGWRIPLVVLACVKLLRDTRRRREA